jgi:prolipoprotein diacylglyceryltransferase
LTIGRARWEKGGMLGPYVHRIDPIIGQIGGVYLWWYGLSFTLGFVGIHLWLRRRRHHLGLTLKEVYDFSILLAVCVLGGGRLVEVVFYEW